MVAEGSADQERKGISYQGTVVMSIDLFEPPILTGPTKLIILAFLREW